MESSEKKRKRGATKHCAYGKCNSDSRYPDRPEMKDVFFIRFPKPGKDFEKCVRWVKACSRKGFDEMWVKKDTYICSIHFVGGKGPTDLHPDPIPANATKYDVQRFQKTPRRKVQRCLALAESQNTNRKTVSLSKPLQYQRHAEQEVAEILLSLSEKAENKENEMFAVHEEGQSSHPVAKANTCMPVDVNRESGQEKVQSLGGSETEIHLKTSDEVFFARKLCSKETQTDPGVSMDISVRIKNCLLESENADLKSKLELSTSTFQETPSTPSSEPITCINVQCAFDFSELENDDKKSKFFTGLTYVRLLQLWSYLSPAIPYLKYWDRASTNKDNYNISPKNAFLMTLMRLRNGYTNQDLAYRFGTSLSNTSVITISWIQFLYSQFLALKEFMFAECSRIQETMPLCFKRYKNIRCIIDCTEFFSQRPRNCQRQGNLFSSYQSHTTYKILVAVAPNGSIMFVSEVFEGSISDRDIVIKSGFLDLLNPGDTIMADRGFNIKDLLNARKVDLIIPPFLMGRKHLTPQEEALTKDIAKHRIHVERSIERMKKFKLLQKTIQLSLEPLMSQINFIVGCLVNFQEPLVK